MRHQRQLFRWLYYPNEYTASRHGSPRFRAFEGKEAPLKKHVSRKKSILSAVALIGIAGLTATSCSGTAPADGGDSAETFNFRAATIYGPDNWQTLALEAYTDAVTEASDGRITFEYFYIDALVTVPEFPDALASGTIDIAPVLGTYTPEKFPMDNWLSGIAFQANAGPPINVLQGSAATQEWAYAEPGYEAEYEANGLHVIVPAALPHPLYDLICNKGPLQTLDDLAGLNTRISGPTTAAVAEAVGMNPISIPPNEIFDSMQRGVIDCMFGPVIDFDSLGLLDVATHGAWLNVAGFSPSTVMMGLDQWNSLPEDLQEIMTAAAPTFVETFAQGKIEGEAISNLKVQDLGIQFDTPKQEVFDAIEVWEDEALANAVATAPDSVENPEESVQRYLDLHETWGGLLEEAGYEGYGSWTEWVAENPTGEIDLEPWVELIRERIYPEQ